MFSQFTPRYSRSTRIYCCVRGKGSRHKKALRPFKGGRGVQPGLWCVVDNIRPPCPFMGLGGSRSATVGCPDGGLNFPRDRRRPWYDDGPTNVRERSARACPCIYPTTRVHDARVGRRHKRRPHSGSMKRIERRNCRTTRPQQSRKHETRT